MRVPRLVRRLALVSGYALIGAVVLIGVGQLFALTRSTCDTICRPEFAAVYGALGGVFFSFIYRPETARPPE